MDQTSYQIKDQITDEVIDKKESSDSQVLVKY